MNYADYRKITLGILLFFIVTAIPVTAETNANEIEYNGEIILTVGEPEATVNGAAMTLDAAPVISSEGRTLVPLRFVTEALGYEIDWYEDSSRITVKEQGETAIQMMIGSPNAVVRGESVSLETAPAIDLLSGRTMVPLRFVSETMGYDVAWDATDQKVTIAGSAHQEMGTDLSVQAPGNGIELQDDELMYDEELETYSLSELQERAVTFNRELKRLEKERERAEIMRREAVLRKTFTPVGTGFTELEFLASQAILGVLSVDAELSINRRMLEAQEQQAEHEVLTKMLELNQALRNHQTAEMALELAQKEERISELKLENGTGSRFELMQARDEVQEKLNELDKTSLGIEEAYENLNLVLGFRIDERYNILRDDEPDLEVPDVDLQVNRVISRSPDLWALEKQVEMAEMGLRLYTYNQNQDPYDAKAIDIDTAKLRLSEAKQQTENAVRDLYNTIQQIENEKNDLELALKQLNDNLGLMKTRLELGMAIPLDVENLEHQGKQLEMGLRNMQDQYEQLIEVYKRPWLSTSNPMQ